MNAGSMQKIRKKAFVRLRVQYTDMYLPGGKGIRIDSAIYSGYTIPPYYDSMVAKLVVWAKNRKEAIRKMQSALGEIIIEGIDTNVDYQYEILHHPDYLKGNIDVGLY